MTTLKQVEAINACGVYHVGNVDLLKSKRNGNGRVCLENVVYLVLPENNEKSREEKIYTLEEVKDIQSKLMLIAGKVDRVKEEVDQFVEV